MNTATASPGHRGRMVFIALLALMPLRAMTADLQSEPPLESLVMKVSFHDLDLTTERGFAIASERVHQAARRLCMRLQDVEDLGHRPAFIHCVDRAVASASLELSALAQRGAGPAVASVSAKEAK